MAASRLGKFIKTRLIEDNKTQADMAAYLGVDPRYLTKIVRGERGPGKYTTGIARYLGVPVEEIHRLAAGE